MRCHALSSGQPLVACEMKCLTWAKCLLNEPIVIVPRSGENSKDTPGLPTEDSAQIATRALGASTRTTSTSTSSLGAFEWLTSRGRFIAGQRVAVETLDVVVEDI
jgi:hypothetical protein